MTVKDRAETQFVVLHTALENFFKGQIVTLEHLKSGQDRDIDVDRLLRLGAIAPVNSDEGRAALAAIEIGAVTPTGELVAAEVPLPPPDATSKKAAKPDVQP